MTEPRLSLMSKLKVIYTALILSVITILLSCSRSKDEGVLSKEGDNYSFVSLRRFTINGLDLITSKDSMVGILGKPDKQVFNFSKRDTLQTIYYFISDSEIGYGIIRDSVVFSHAIFKNESLVIKNEIGSFSDKTKLDIMKLVFSDSYDNRVYNKDEEVLFLKIEELEGAWIRLIFVKGFLNSIYFDYPNL
jgi:hypothetical protein